MFKVLKGVIDILLKWVTNTIQNQTKEQKWLFLQMLLGTLGPKVNVTRYFVRKRVNRKEMLRAGYI